MTGRQLIVYILANNLEDEPVVNDGIFVGFMSEEEAAKNMGVGVATIRSWCALGMLNHVVIGDNIFIPKVNSMKLLVE